MRGGEEESFWLSRQHWGSNLGPCMHNAGSLPTELYLYPLPSLIE